MSVETDIQEGMYSIMSELLSKADTFDKASGFIATFLQQKMGEGVIDLYDYKIEDHGLDGYHADVEFVFSWNLTNNFVHMLVIPSTSPSKAYDRAMGIIGG